jgi:hypothetical protein
MSRQIPDPVLAGSEISGLPDPDPYIKTTDPRIRSQNKYVFTDPQTTTLVKSVTPGLTSILN